MKWKPSFLDYADVVCFQIVALYKMLGDIWLRDK
jgi:hypothetical protein